MGVVAKLFDGLSNVMTGSGTSVDGSMYRRWQERQYGAYDVDVAYRSSWLMRKIIDVPAQDATREWRDWQAKADQIELLEAEEQRLRVRATIREGLIYGRLGGGIVIMGVNVGQPNLPLPDNLPKGCLRYLRAYSRQRVRLGPLISDPMDDAFGEPESFVLKTDKGQKEIPIHRSRVLVFKGPFAGNITTTTSHGGSDPYWGGSVVAAVNDAVMNATSAQDEIAGLIEEAKIDVFGIPDLLTLVGDPESEKRVLRRLELANSGKSNHRAVIKDALETWEQRQITWTGMPEVINVFLAMAAGASDIPATRLLGKAPDGMNATGEGDQSNYDQMVRDIQESDLRPALGTLDAALIPSALGSVPPEVYYEFAPLSVPNETQRAAIEKQEADTVTAIINAGLIPDEAMAQTVANRMIESGRWPGLEAALANIGEKWWEVMAEEAQAEQEAEAEAELARIAASKPPVVVKPNGGPPPSNNA